MFPYLSVSEEGMWIMPLKRIRSVSQPFDPPSRQEQPEEYLNREKWHIGQKMDEQKRHQRPDQRFGNQGSTSAKRT
jgi:hypothetical protein